MYMNCQRCGSKIEKGWAFCPRCGFRQGGDFFGDILSRMRKELAQMNRLFEKDIEAFDLSPWFRDMEKRNILKEGGKAAFPPIVLNPKGSGFTIKIIQSGGNEPKISVNTFGDVDKDKIKKELGQMGIWQPDFQSREKPAYPESKEGHSQAHQASLVHPAVTEEPKTTVKRTATNVAVFMELPGVKSESDITVSELENSIEVKALAGDKAYFKILTKPPQFRLVKKVFSKGTLHMDFS